MSVFTLDTNDELELISLRRKFHSYPELGWTEYVTTWRIIEALEGTAFSLYVGREVVDPSARMGVPSEKQLELEEQRAKDYGVPNEIMEKMKGGCTGVAAIFDTGKEGPHIALRFDIDALPIQEADSLDHFPFRGGLWMLNS